MEKLFQDRRDAGRRLARRLQQYKAAKDCLVVALPRGGVPVGFELARILHLPLDLCLVRKLGVPFQPELAMGAIASGNVVVLHDYLIRDLGITRHQIDHEIELESRELARREHLYRGGRPAPDLRGKTILLVDDGIATGSTTEAAIRVLRAQGVARIVIAVAVASPAALQRLSHLADEVVSVLKPPALSSVGEWFNDFLQVDDGEVTRLLAEFGPPHAE